MTWYPRALRWAYGRLLRRGRFHFVVQTEPLRDAWSKAYGPGAVTLIPIGVSQGRQAVDRVAEKKRLGLPIDRPIVAVLGAIRTAKGYPELFAAYNGHPKPCYFLLAGDRPEWAPPDPRDVARDHGCESETILWLRFIPEDEFATLIAAVDVVAMLYRNPDGSSGILSRCLELGTPVLSTREGHLGAVTRDSGAGATADPASPRDVRETLNALLARSSQSARESSSEMLPDWSIVARRYLERFHGLEQAP
jgi:glycosyltransferase involved in cell wall biosynthesis